MKQGALGVWMCILAMAAGLGCDDGAQAQDPPGLSSNESGVYACNMVQRGGAWSNQAISPQSGRFHIEFSATPSAMGLDTVIGLSSAATTKWAGMAAIVRFNPDGYIDVRSGDQYSRSGYWPYAVGTKYDFRFDVDVPSHTYAVWIRTGGDTAPWNPLIKLAVFRTEQQSVTKLANVAAYTNPDTSAAGGVNLCGFTVAADTTPVSTCSVSKAGGGFVNRALTKSENVLMVSFRARPLAAGMDGVVGISSGVVDGYDDFAAAIRFYTNGRVEVRDGDAYRADTEVTYIANREFDVRMFIDLPSHTYSVYVNYDGLTPNNDGHVLLASGYKFRSAQAKVTQLDNLATVVASSAGSVEVCGITGGPHATVQSIHDGEWDVEGLANGATVISTYNRTTLLASNNVPMGASLPFGGQATVDASGNVYVAHWDANYNAEVVSYAADFTTKRWSRILGTQGLTDIAVTPAGEIVVAVWNVRAIARISNDGRVLTWDPLPQDGYMAAFGRNRYVVARNGSGISLEAYAYGDPTHPLVTRQLPNNAFFDLISVAPDNSVIIGGVLYGTANFGDGDLTPVNDSSTGTYLRGFVAAFGPDLTTRFSRRLGYEVSGVSAMSFTTGRRFAVASETFHNASYVDYVIYDGAGNVLKSSSGDAFVGTFGMPGTITMTPTGMVYLNEHTSLGDSTETYHPFLLALSPW